METYSIEVTPNADADVERCYRYLVEVLHSWEAADAFLDDYYESLDKLSLVAGKLKMGEHPLMKSRALRRLNFHRHHYFLLYRMEGLTAVIIAVAHFRQDISNVLK